VIRLIGDRADHGGSCNAMSDNAEHGAVGVGALSPAAGRARRQRRPTGEPPPLPHPVTVTTTAWLVLAAIALASAIAAAQHTSWLGIDDRADTWVLRQLAVARTPRLTEVANGINVAGSGWGVSVPQAAPREPEAAIGAAGSRLSGNSRYTGG
jgi:hypothetical protein